MGCIQGKNPKDFQLSQQDKKQEGKQEGKESKPASETWNYKKQGQDWNIQGTSQSPVNVVTSQVQQTTDVKLFVDYTKSVYEYVLHPGHHYKLEGAFGTLELQDKSGKRNYQAAQFHFHAPSEHQIDGQLGDLEVHIVHSNQSFPDFQNAVLGFIFKEGINKNDFLDKVLNGQAVCLNDLLVSAQKSQTLQGTQVTEVFHYKGSLTTPPCTENVNWLLYSKTIEASPDQIKFFKRMWAENKHFAEGKGSNRAVQDLGKRQVLLLKA